MDTKKKSKNRAEGGFIAFVAELILVVFLIYYSIARAIVNYFIPYKKYKDISNEIVLITGGGRGLGRVLAVEFAKFNPRHIVLWGRHEDTLCATTKAVRIHGVPCTYMVCDVSDPKQVTEQAKLLMEEVGDVSMLVNNAAIVNGKTIVGSSTEEINNTISVNTLAQFWTVKAFLPSMLRNNHGHIVSMNSTLGMMGLSSVADYCASKFACRGLSESLLLEVLREGKTGIHITDVHPGQTNTDMFAGLSHRFIDWFPPLDKEYVAAKTVRSILLNKREVIMPRIMHAFVFIKSILPVEALLQIYKFLGMDKAMDGFHGRKKEN